MSTMTISPAGRSARAARRPVARRPVVPATPGRGERSTPTPLRLTRRGRLLATVLVAAAGLGILGMAQPEALALGGSSAPATRQVTVRPGETLWAIATRVAPHADPRDTIARLEVLNDLPDSTVPAGSVLLVPAG